MDSAPTLTPRRQRLLLAAVMSGLLLSMLDQTIVGTALPTIVRDLHGSNLYVWVVTAYLVPATVTLPIYARMSDRYGRRALLLAGMIVFLVGSAAAATTHSMDQLIGWRAVQGLGAGALESLSFILVADLYGGKRSAALQAMLTGLMAVSFIGGPLVGGFLTQEAGWRSVFVVNLPIGIAAVVIVSTVLPASIGRRESRAAPFDLAGIAALTGLIGLLLVGLNDHSQQSATGALPAWTELRTGGVALAGLALLPAFLWIESRAQAPILPLRLFADRRTALILLAASTAMFGLFASVLLLPRYFQNAQGVSAVHSGLLIYPLFLGLLVFVNLAPRIIVRRGTFRRTILGGCALAALGALGFGTFSVDTPAWQSIAFMAMIGAGIGPALSGLQIAIQRTVAPSDVAAVMGTLLLLRQIGGAIALAAAQTLYVVGLHDDHPAAAASATGHALVIVSLIGTAITAGALLALPRGAGRVPLIASTATQETEGLGDRSRAAGHRDVPPRAMQREPAAGDQGGRLLEQRPLIEPVASTGDEQGRAGDRRAVHEIEAVLGVDRRGHVPQMLS